MTATAAEPTSVPALAPRAVLLYDAACPLCRASVALLRPFDWLGRIELRDARNPSTWPDTPQPLGARRVLDEIHLVSANRRRVWAGFAAARRLAWMLPGLWLVAPLLYVPGVLPLGNVAYRWVARNRFRLVPCKDGACEVGNRGSSSGPPAVG